MSSAMESVLIHKYCFSLQ